MGALRRLVARLRHRRYADDVAEELRTHRLMLEQELAARGLTASQARDESRRRMGNELQAQEEVRAVWLAPWWDQAAQDVRVAGRQIRRAPGFAATVIVLCALAVGATTAIISVVNALLIVPLPYPQVERVYALWTAAGGGTDGETFHAVLARSTAFAAVAAQRSTSGWSLVAGDHAEAVSGLRVSSRYFEVLDVPPAAGRGFTASEDTSGGPDVVVISDALRSRIRADAGTVLGATVLLGGTPHQIVGVMPASFRSTPPVDVWTPLRLSARDNSPNYLVLGRLAAGTDAGRAAGELDVIKAGLLVDQADEHHTRTRSLQWRPLERVLGLELALPLLVAWLAVTAMTAVACTNLTGLLLFRTLAREREVATRLALGGSHGRVARQFLTESLVLAAAGGVAGVTLAMWAVPALTRLVPPSLLAGRSLQLDPVVLTAAIVCTVTIGIGLGLAPALAARGFDMRAVAVQSRGSFGSRRQAWARRLLVSGEIAATTVLLVIGSVLGHVLLTMSRADLGFDPAGVTVGRTSLSGARSGDPRRFQAFVERALGRLRDIPGIEGAALASSAPVERGLNLPMQPPPRGLVAEVRSVDWRYVTADYFTTLRIAVGRGRVFDARDAAGAMPVAVVNEAFAVAYFGREDVLGETISMDAALGDAARAIVGVVANSRSQPGAGWTRGLNALGSAPPPIVYVPLAQAPVRAISVTHEFFPAAWIVRAIPGTPDLDRAIEAAVRGADPAVAFVNIQPLAQVVANDIHGPRTIASIVGGLAALSLLIASTGIFGLVAYAAGVRRQETAVRLALGASRTSLVRTFVNETIAIAAGGVVVGVVAALFASRLLQATIGGVARLDLGAVALAATTLVLVVGAAAAAPAIRASGADPARALRAE